MANLKRIFAENDAKGGVYVRECFKCGYDLYGSPGPDCPECGHKMHRLNYPPEKRMAAMAKSGNSAPV